jgi:sugar diacid utilization regulator
VPRSLAVLALSSDSPEAVVRRLDIDVLVSSDAAGAWLVVPDPDGPGRAATLRRALSGAVSALGPAVVPRDAGRSLQWARKALELVQLGALPSGRPTRVEDHLAAMIMLGDQDIARALVARRLGPLEALPGGERDRLLETLGAWLAHQRHTPSVAAELHVHPQTVRYRVGRLRELLGGTLEDADGRFELELALRAGRALPGEHP